MQTDESLKATVKEMYGKIAEQDKGRNASTCCGATIYSDEFENFTIMAESYEGMDGYNPDADLGLGCGLPTQFAKIQKGDVVVDLGSGAGNDCFVARAETGETGKVIGVDFTEAMIEKARQNAEKLGYNNVEFRFGDIEKMPISSSYADVIVSNCVLNLVPNKPAVFAEMMRVLKPGGHFSVSDIVLVGNLPAKAKDVAALYAGCVSGAIQRETYIKQIEEAGFTNVTLQKDREITIPDSVLEQYLSAEEIAEYRASNAQVRSISVYAKKAGIKPLKLKVQLEDLPKDACCSPSSGCC